MSLTKCIFNVNNFLVPLCELFTIFVHFLRDLDISGMVFKFPSSI